MMFDNVEKSVLKGPFKQSIYPVWMYDHKNLNALGNRALNFFAKPNLLTMGPVAVSGLLCG
jgi:hypothetical protein